MKTSKQSKIDFSKLDLPTDQEIREETRREKIRQTTADRWKDQQTKYTFISPGNDYLDQYDYFNSIRKSNQKMPIPPSLVYMFRELEFTAKEVKTFCWESEIYCGTDYSFWYKILKHPYPWFSLKPSEIYKFESTEQALQFVNSKFDKKWTYNMIHEYSDGYQQHGFLAGWIIQKQPK
jgi:hypothetical protein